MVSGVMAVTLSTAGDVVEELLVAETEVAAPVSAVALLTLGATVGWPSEHPGNAPEATVSPTLTTTTNVVAQIDLAFNATPWSLSYQCTAPLAARPRGVGWRSAK
jgi:cation transporter-like permease